MHKCKVQSEPFGKIDTFNQGVIEHMTEVKPSTVKYVGPDLVTLKCGKTYEVLSVEKGWYRIMTETDEDYGSLRIPRDQDAEGTR